MKVNAYVIFDSPAKVYNKPFYLLNDQIAVRAMEDLINDDSTDIARHPSDFSLWRVGSYDDTTATFTSDEQLTLVCRAHELQRRDPIRMEQPSGETE